LTRFHAPLFNIDILYFFPTPSHSLSSSVSSLSVSHSVSLCMMLLVVFGGSVCADIVCVPFVFCDELTLRIFDSFTAYFPVSFYLDPTLP